MYIEERVVKEKIGYMDAIIDYCTTNDVDIEGIANLVVPSLKEKIQLEAEEANMMRPRGRLPV